MALAFALSLKLHAMQHIYHFLKYVFKALLRTVNKRFSFSKCYCGAFLLRSLAGEMAYWVKVFADKPDDGIKFLGPTG